MPAWRETSFFTAAEQAALGFADSITLMTEDHVPASAYETVAAQYGPDEIAALVSSMVAINAWNAIGVSTRAWAPGSYSR